MLELAARNKFSLPESLVAFMKQILYISGVCRILEPDFDVLGDIAPIVALARQPRRPVAA
jgi:predicted unusual protein kinase regulating ubiquinone biosynthesis (AarF/ABC1/UbiB family)